MRFKCKKIEECKHCGGCCHFREQSILTKEEDLKLRKNMYDKTGILYIYPFSRYTISVNEDEKIVLEKLAKENNIKLIIKPKKIILVENQKKILDYFLDHDVCPFWINEKCSIYNDRPEVCKLFPKLPKTKIVNYKTDLSFKKIKETVLSKLQNQAQLKQDQL